MIEKSSELPPQDPARMFMEAMEETLDEVKATMNDEEIHQGTMDAIYEATWGSFYSRQNEAVSARPAPSTATPRA